MPGITAVAFIALTNGVPRGKFYSKYCKIFLNKHWFANLGHAYAGLRKLLPNKRPHLKESHQIIDAALSKYEQYRQQPETVENSIDFILFIENKMEELSAVYAREWRLFKGKPADMMDFAYGDREKMRALRCLSSCVIKENIVTHHAYARLIEALMTRKINATLSSSIVNPLPTSSQPQVPQQAPNMDKSGCRTVDVVPREENTELVVADAYVIPQYQQVEARVELPVEPSGPVFPSVPTHHPMVASPVNFYVLLQGDEVNANNLRSAYHCL